MLDLGQLIAGEDEKPDYSKLVTDELLDRLRLRESGNKPYQVNPETKAIGPYQFMPSTVNDLYKKGTKFDPFDEKQSREVARKYLTDLVTKNNGDVDKALAQYGGFVTKDPSAYVSAVNPKNDLNSLIAGEENVPAPVAKGKPVVQMVQPNLLDKTLSAVRGEEAQPVAGVTAEDMTKPFIGYRKTKSKVGQLDTSKVVPELANLADVVGNLPAQAAGLFVQAGARVAGQGAEKSEQFGQKVGKVFENPFARITNTEDYKSALTSPIGKYISEHINDGVDSISQATGMHPEDVRMAINAIGMFSPAFKGVPAKAVGGLRSVGETIGDVRGQLKSQLEARQVPQAGMVSAGAAHAELPTSIKSELADAPEPVKQAYANVPDTALSDKDLTFIKTHKLFNKFGDVPTEGEALQDPQLMSQEYNYQNQKGNEPLAQKLAGRDEKVIKAIEQTKQAIAPEVFETTPQKSANLTLEKLVQNDEERVKNIRQNYKELADANGGELPLSGHNIALTAELLLKEENVARFLPKEIKDIIDELKDSGDLRFNDYQNYLTILGRERRKFAKTDGNATHAIDQVRDAFEKTEMTPATAEVNQLAKKARASAKARFDLMNPESETYIPAYKAAVEGDTRSAAEKLEDTPHPASNTFIDKYYNNKTPQVYLNRLINEIGRDSTEHQGLNSALIDNLNSIAGVRNGKGKPSQAAINKFIYDPVKGYGNNLPTMLGSEKFKELQDLADYARMTDHTAVSGSTANVSGSGMLINQGPIGQAFEKAGSLAASALEHGVNIKTASPAGTIARTFLKGSAEAKALKAEEAAKAAKLQQTLAPKPPSKISEMRNPK